tara:strand:- start:16917 stop:17240 length:324 start_codon:yes stop_codon:yes gene_type:complete
MVTYNPDRFKNDLLDEVMGFIRSNLAMIPDLYGVSIWCENNSPELAQIYQKYIGVRHSLIYASHTMYFIHTTVGAVQPVDKILSMVRTFIECQLYDYPLATDYAVSF